MLKVLLGDKSYLVYTLILILYDMSIYGFYLNKNYRNTELVISESQTLNLTKKVRLQLLFLV